MADVSPAKIVATYLVYRGAAVWFPAAGTWQMAYHREPEGTNIQDRIITVFNDGAHSEGGSTGRREGRWKKHPVVQIRIRTSPNGYTEGWNKGQTILDFLAQIRNQVVTAIPTETTNWIIRGFTVEPSELLHVEEQEIHNREIFTLNGQVTVEPQ
jgi:hypothetical protein